MTDEYGYECPYCKEQGTTTVIRTLNMRSCILRVRKCRVCGQKIETVETSVDMSEELKELGMRQVRVLLAQA